MSFVLIPHEIECRVSKNVAYGMAVAAELHYGSKSSNLKRLIIPQSDKDKSASHILLDDEADVYRIHPMAYIDVEDQNKMSDIDIAKFLLEKRHLDEITFKHTYYIDTSITNSKEFIYTNDIGFTRVLPI